MAKLPHADVYVRLKSSRIHGVGVFAIRDIPKGANICADDNSKMIWIKASHVKGMSDDMRKLYSDFGVLKNGKYGCPKSFNMLTVGWYINHSKHPNVKADKEYNFYSTRRIKKGEELTADYDTYSGSFAVQGRRIRAIPGA